MMLLWEGDLFQLIANNGMVWISRTGSDDIAPCSILDDAMPADEIALWTTV